MASSLHHQSSHWLRATVLAATAVAFTLSLKKAASTPIDVDELFEVQQFVAPTLAHYFTNYFANGQLPHVLLTKLFAAIHWDIFTLRLGSVFAGTLAVPLMYRAATEILQNRRVAVLSAVLLAVSLEAINFAAFIRGYSLLLVLSLAMLFCFAKAVATAQTRWWLALSIFTAVSLHNHVFVVFLLPPLALYFLWGAWSNPASLRIHLRPLPVSAGVLLVLMLPMPLLLQASRHTSDSLSNLLSSNTSYPSSFPPLSVQNPLALLDPLAQMAYTFSPGRQPGWTAWLFVALFAAGTVAGLRRPQLRRPVILLLLVIFVPPLLMTVATTLLGPWFYALRRYFLFVLPPYLMLASTGILALARLAAGRWPAHRRLADISVTAGLTLLVVWPSARFVLAPAEAATAGQFAAARYLNRHAQPGDTILCVPDEDFRISGGREFCSLTLHLYPALAPGVFSLDHLAGYDTAQQFVKANGNCASRYIHLPHPEFAVDCDTPPPVPPTGRLWLVLWRSRDVSQEAARTGPAHQATVARFPGADVLHVPPTGTLPGQLLAAAKIAVSEAVTPPRRLENLISMATLALAAGQLEAALAALDEAVFVSRWPQAVQQLTELQTRMSYLPLPLAPAVPVGQSWANQIALLGLDQNLSERAPAPGAPLQISFYWQIIGPVEGETNVLLHLLKADGSVAAAFDFTPFNGARPFWQFTPGQPVRETRAFDWPARLPSGPLRLVVGLYRPDTLVRLSLDREPTETTVSLAEWVVK